MHNPESGEATLCGPKVNPYFVPFDFRRLGLRVTSMLISPWVARGSVIQEPTKPFAGSSQFEHSSFSATAKNLFNLTGFLTKRDAWAGSFDELLLDKPRTDCPMHLPEAPPTFASWDRPQPNMSTSAADAADDDDGRRQLLHGFDVADDTQPQHCSSRDGGHQQQQLECTGGLSTKQRRRIELYAQLTMTPVPDIGAMGPDEANAFASARWDELMAR